jgi:hypothetical protein
MLLPHKAAAATAAATALHAFIISECGSHTCLGWQWSGKGRPGLTGGAPGGASAAAGTRPLTGSSQKHTARSSSQMPEARKTKAAAASKAERRPADMSSMDSSTHWLGCGCR